MIKVTDEMVKAAVAAYRTSFDFIRGPYGIELAPDVPLEHRLRVIIESALSVPAQEAEPVASVERLAEFLHGECAWPEYDFPQHSWPDHPDDDGKRGDGYLKIVPKSSADEFRNLAQRIISALHPTPAYSGEREALERAAAAKAVSDRAADLRTLADVAAEEAQKLLMKAQEKPNAKNVGIYSLRSNRQQKAKWFRRAACIIEDLQIEGTKP